MHKITIDAAAGTLNINGIVIVPVSLAVFRERLASASVVADELHPNEHFTTYAFDGSMDDEAFGVNITYFKDQLEAVWLGWDGGVTKIKGYNTSTRELLDDKEKLAKFLSRVLHKEPDERTETYASFIYEWGQISAAASLRAVTVSIGMVWSR